MISDFVVVKQHSQYDVNPIKYIKAGFMTQDMIYFGECSMYTFFFNVPCTLEKNVNSTSLLLDGILYTYQ